MNVSFIDTSIIMNLLEIPQRCQNAEEIKKEFKEAVDADEVLILPMPTIIESGNHISHIADGNIRRKKAVEFQTFLRKTALQEAPWKLYGVEFTSDDLLALAEKFPDYAQKMEMGIGDMSIIRFYEKYKNTDDIKVGDIIVFYEDDIKIIHRIIDQKLMGGETRYYTKGDANQNKDDGYRIRKDIIGQVKARIPYIGYLTLWINNLIGGNK